MAVSKKKAPASKAKKAAPARAKAQAKKAPARASAPKAKPASAASAAPEAPRIPSGKIAEMERALEEAREQIRFLTEDRDNQVALAEAADTERAVLQRQFDDAQERIRALEKQIEQGLPRADAAAAGTAVEVDEGLEFEEEEAETEPSDDLDDVEAIYDRMDDPRVRRQELDRERIDRESEAGDEPYWMVCPKCGDSLDEVDSEDVKIDRCENCGGIYLDRGEVEMLLTLGRGPEGLRRIRSALTI